MITVMRISAEPRGEMYEEHGEWMIRFPWPEGVVHHVVVPEPYQCNDPAPFDHHEKGSNRTCYFNMLPGMTEAHG